MLLRQICAEMAGNVESNGSGDVTGMHVGAEGERAVLYVEREAEDLKVTGADQPQHPVIADVARVVHIHIRTGLRYIVIHTKHQKRKRTNINLSWNYFIIHL